MIEVSYIENIAYEQYTQMCVVVRKDYRILLRWEHSPISVHDTIDIEVGCRAVTTGKLVSPRLSNNASCRHAGTAHVGSRRRSSRAWGGGERDHQPQRSDGFKLFAITKIPIKFVCNNWIPKQICVQ